ncbi:MAG: hypothetical protein ACRD3G_22430 [Vicinamibacterales bacterium]
MSAQSGAESSFSASAHSFFRPWSALFSERAASTATSLFKFSIHILTGTVLFVLVAIPAVAINLTLEWLRGAGVDGAVLLGLQAAEIALLLTDMGLFVVFSARAVKSTVREVFHLE